MSQENVELHALAFDAWNRRDLETWLGLADPDVEFIPFNLEMEGGASYRGHDGIRSFWETYLAVFPDFNVDHDEIRDLGKVTVAHVRLLGRGAGSDAPIIQRLWQVAEWRDEKCVWWKSFRTEAEALEAAGLAE